jgi:hypothetical protein
MMAPVIIIAQDGLTGRWKYQFPAGEMTMNFSNNTLTIDGESYTYKAENNRLYVYEGNTYTVYAFILNGNNLTLTFPDGSRIAFNRESAGEFPVNKAPADNKGATSVQQDSKPSSLTGRWQYQGPEGNLVLEFLSGSQLVFNGESTEYRVQEGMIQAKGDYGWINYPYTFSQNKLIITFPDGNQVPFARVSSSSPGQAVANRQSSGGNLIWQLNGSLCFWSGSSGSSASYSRSEKISFDGQGNFVYGREGSFSSNAGNAYSGNPNLERGTYRVEDRFVILQFQSGETLQVEIIMRQNSGRITELRYQGKLYATSLCE